MRVFQWFFCWKTVRRGLIGLVGLITLITLFYTVENWRGKRAWEKCKREFEAKGQVLDWSAYIPAPIPDEQNIFKAPKMTEWFVGRGALLPPSLYNALNSETTASVIAAEVTIVSTAEAKALHFDDPAAPQLAANALLSNIGPRIKSSRGDNFVIKEDIKPVQIVLQTDHSVNAEEVAKFFPGKIVARKGKDFLGKDFLGDSAVFSIEPAGNNRFHIILDQPRVAADFLEASDSLEADFNIIREAFKRPHARIDGDYEHPFQMSIVANFAALRSTTQMLASRTQCYLLLHQPDKALQELTLLHDLCRLLRNEPTDKLQTWVEAMIGATVTELYVYTIADGIRLHEWNEPQMILIQEQLSKIDLPSSLIRAFQSEPVAYCHALETIKSKDLSEMFDSNKRFTPLRFTPRGWLYQNMAHYVSLMRKAIDHFNASKGFSPTQIASLEREAAETSARYSPYSWLSSIAMPHYSKAIQQCAKIQTLVNQAQIACALERYHLARNQYPETLNDLIPQFIDKIPHDIIKGQPLVYKRTENGRFLLYSIGWNESDDGGNADKDWVWGGTL